MSCLWPHYLVLWFGSLQQSRQSPPQMCTMRIYWKCSAQSCLFNSCCLKAALHRQALLKLLTFGHHFQPVLSNPLCSTTNILSCKIHSLKIIWYPKYGAISPYFGYQIILNFCLSVTVFLSANEVAYWQSKSAKKKESLN